MPRHARRLVVFLTPLLLLAACGSSGRQHTARLLNRRMQTLLANDIAAGRAAVQPRPDGTRITLLDAAPTPGGPAVSDPNEGSLRASLIEGLLDPTLMRVAVTDTSTLPDDQRDARIKSLTDYFQSYGLGPVLLPNPPPQPMPSGSATPTPPGVTVTIALYCPRRPGIGYGSGQRQPACD